jgi:hypothetical protein
MKGHRKITVLVRSDLLDKAQNAVRAGIGDTVHKGLELLAASDAYDRLLKMRGKVRFSVNSSKLREDRR